MTCLPIAQSAPADRDYAALRDALEALQAAQNRVLELLSPETERDHPAPLSARPGTLATGGVVILTDDGRGIARAVAADLQALGHPVVRVRHGVGQHGVEGLNLSSAAAVAALVERARMLGPIAAIGHLRPLRVADHPGGPADALDARSLLLLTHAASTDLHRSAQAGGSALVVTTPVDACWRGGDRGLGTLQGPELGDTRMRQVAVDPTGEIEVVAADLVREILTLDTQPEVVYRDGQRFALPAERIETAPDHAILLGAPDRASWMTLARALVAWLDDHPDAKLRDLAFTLHHGQPAYSFRVGIVTHSIGGLADRLRKIMRSLHDPARESLADPDLGYWNPKPRQWLPLDDRSSSNVWVEHWLAYQFARGGAIRADFFVAAGQPPSLLDLDQGSEV